MFRIYVQGMPLILSVFSCREQTLERRECGGRGGGFCGSDWLLPLSLVFFFQNVLTAQNRSSRSHSGPVLVIIFSSAAFMSSWNSWSTLMNIFFYVSHTFRSLQYFILARKIENIADESLLCLPGYTSSTARPYNHHSVESISRRSPIRYPGTHDEKGSEHFSSRCCACFFCLSASRKPTVAVRSQPVRLVVLEAMKCRRLAFGSVCENVPKSTRPRLAPASGWHGRRTYRRRGRNTTQASARLQNASQTEQLHTCSLGHNAQRYNNAQFWSFL